MAILGSPMQNISSQNEIWSSSIHEPETVNSDTSFELKWNNYSSSLPSAFDSMRKAEDFVDVTLATSGHQDDSICNRYKAHRIVLSACSTYLRSVLRDLPRWQHPVIMMPKDLPGRDLEDILTFIYWGKVHVDKDRLSSFLKSAEALQIKGLASASAPTENSTEQNSMSDDRTSTAFDNIQTNVKDRNTQEDLWIGHQNKSIGNGRPIKRSSPSPAQMNVQPQTSSQATTLLGYNESNKRCRTNKFETISANTRSTSSPTDIIINKNNSLLDSTEASNNVMTINNIAELQTNESSSLADFQCTIGGASTQSLLRVKEENSSISNFDLNTTNPINGRSAKSRNSYIQQSEHVVIPTDPSLMQGLDSGSVEQETLQQSALQSYSSNSQLTQQGPPKSEQVSSSSGVNDRNNMVSKIGANDLQTPHKEYPKSIIAIDKTNTCANTNPSAVEPLVVLFSEKGRCHFCRVLCPDIQALKTHLETTHQPPKHALCENCENFFHVCAIHRHKQKCTETYQSEKLNS